MDQCPNREWLLENRPCKGGSSHPCHCTLCDLGYEADGCLCCFKDELFENVCDDEAQAEEEEEDEHAGRLCVVCYSAWKSNLICWCNTCKRYSTGTKCSLDPVLVEGEEMLRMDTEDQDWVGFHAFKKIIGDGNRFELAGILGAIF